MEKLLQKIRSLIDESGYDLEDILAEISKEEDDYERIMAYSVAYQYALQKDKNPQIKLLREKYNRILDNLKQTYMPLYRNGENDLEIKN